MVKRREKTSTLKPADYEERVEAFASGADGIRRKRLNPNAPRNYKSINVPLNEYEHHWLERAAKKMGRSKLDYIRRAVLDKAKRDFKK